MASRRGFPKPVALVCTAANRGADDARLMGFSTARRTADVVRRMSGSGPNRRALDRVPWTARLDGREALPARTTGIDSGMKAMPWNVNPAAPSTPLMSVQSLHQSMPSWKVQ